MCGRLLGLVESCKFFFVSCRLERLYVLCLIKFSPMHRIMGTSSWVSGPRSFLTVTTSSVTWVLGSKMSLFFTAITLA